MKFVMMEIRIYFLPVAEGKNQNFVALFMGNPVFIQTEEVSSGSTASNWIHAYEATYRRNRYKAKLKYLP
jgi:hypothetical protein